jgi:hypothetical protein
MIRQDPEIFFVESMSAVGLELLARYTSPS